MESSEQSAPVPSPSFVGGNIPRKSWEYGLGPHYIGLFLCVLFYDRLVYRTVPVGGLFWSAAGVAAAGLLGYLLFYLAPALWGRRSERGLMGVTQATFGEAGAKWLPGLLIGVAQVAWFAISVGYGAEYILRGLVVGRFLDPKILRPMVVGGMLLESPLFLMTTLFWSFTVSLIAIRFVRLVAAIMTVFPIFAATIIGGAMLAMLGGLRDFSPTGFDPVLGRAISSDVAGRQVFSMTVQFVLGFFALAGLGAADWGAASLSEREVKLGGFASVGLAPIVIAMIALLTAAGYLGKARVSSETLPPPTEIIRPGGAAPSRSVLTVSESAGATYEDVLRRGFDGPIGAGMLMYLGMAALAPATYAASSFGRRFAPIFPRLSRMYRTLIGTVLAWPLMALGLSMKVELLYGLFGAAFAPVAGALAADFMRNKGAWPGPRKGVNLPGWVAWFVGFLVGLIPTISGPVGSSAVSRFQPAALWAFVAAYVVYSVLSTLRLESAVNTESELDPSETFDVFRR